MCSGATCWKIHRVRYRLAACLLTLVLFLAVASPLQAQDPQLAATLALPMSPGAIALLAEHPTDRAAQQRVKEGLADARAETRTVAARVIFDTGMRGLLADVQGALAKEQDPIAAAEEARAWMTLDPAPATYAACVEAATRLGYPVTPTVIDTFARLNARELLNYLPQLAGHGDIVNAIMVVTASDRPARGQTAQALVKSPALLDPLLVAMHKDGDHPPPDLLIALLRSADADSRVVGIWYLALCQAMDGTAMTPEVKAALDPLIDANPTQVTWEAFGLELLSRAEGRKPRERRWTDLAKSPRPASARHEGDDPLFLRLTDTELEDYFEVTNRNRGGAKPFRARTEAQGHPAPPAHTDADRPIWLTADVGVRTVPPFVGGLWTELLALTRCQPHLGSAVAVNVSYKPDGRPARISAGDTNVPDACLRFALVLFSLTVAEEARPRPATFTDVVMLSLSGAGMTCADRAVPLIVDNTRRRIAKAASATDGAPKGESPSYVPPKRMQEFPPAYTEEARRRRLEGNVFVRATLTPDGCFSQGNVLTSPSPMLSGPALLSTLDGATSPGASTISRSPSR